MTIRAVGAVALKDSPCGELQVLLIRKRGGLWTLPKGRVKRGELEDAALVREFREETGLDCAVGEAVSQLSYQIIKAGRVRRKVVTYYLVLPEGGTLRPGLSEGIEAARWVSLPKALRRIGRPRIRAVLRSALTQLAP